MKTTRLCIATLLGICLAATAGYSQETIIASTVDGSATPVSEPESTESEESKQDEPTFSFSGSVDTYFHSTLGTTNSAYGGISAPASAFADLKGFGLGMANIIASYGGDKVGFTADLVFGPRGKA